MTASTRVRPIRDLGATGRDYRANGWQYYVDVGHAEPARFYFTSHSAATRFAHYDDAHRNCWLVETYPNPQAEVTR